MKLHPRHPGLLAGRVFAGILALLSWLPLATHAAGEERAPPSPEWLKMIVPSSTTSLKIAPDGRRLAGMAFDNFTSSVFIVDLPSMKARTIVASQKINMRLIYTREPVRVSWIDSELLAVDFNDDESESFDVSGKKLADLGARYLRPMLEEGKPTGWVLVYTDEEHSELAAVHPRTGERRRFKVSLSGTLMHGAFDAKGVLRAVTMRDSTFWTDKTTVRNWFRAGADAPWRLMQEADITQDYWLPVHVPPEPETLVVRSREGRDTVALFRFDTRTLKHVDLLAGHPKEDLVAAEGLDQPIFERVETAGLKRTQYWFDERWFLVQKSIDQALPGRVNMLDGDKNGLVLVASRSDVDPGRWYLFDSVRGTLRQIAEVNPAIDPAAMRPMRTLSYRSFDGLEIPAYLTLPVAGERPPLVVLIHGGPHSRDDWEWNQEVQVLAANGYAVFQPQFRGSQGFGARYEQAGYREWGRAMQDDITAGVRYLIDNHLVDERRICIVGASYGGYAALWGLVKTPELYRCGVSFAGVSDVAYMYRDWSDIGRNAIGREFRRARIGDEKTAEERYDNVSPLKQAQRIQAPVLIMHGEKDRRVPVAHGERMAEALRAHGKPYEWLAFPSEGHGLRYVANRKLYYETLLAFLDRHIGSPTTARP